MTPSRASAPAAAAHRGESPRVAAPLVRLHDARETVVAGVDGAAIAVRTLDGVSLRVGPGELLVVRGAPSDGTSALARMLAGHRRFRRDPTAGERVVLPGTRVRRGAIGARAAEALVRGWRAGHAGRVGGGDSGGDGDRARTVYLLRVRDDADVGGSGHADGALAWRTWAALVRREGGAVVLLEHPAFEGGAFSTGGSGVPVASIVREGVASSVDLGVAGGASADDGDGVRVVRLVAGRLLEAERPGVPSAGSAGGPTLRRA